MNNEQLNQQKTYKLAVTSFILSLLFFIPFVPYLGVILGVIARRRFIKAHRLKGKGRGLAITAIFIGALFGFLGIMALGEIVPSNIFVILLFIALAIFILGLVYLAIEDRPILKIIQELDLKERKLKEIEETLSEKEDLKEYIAEAKAHIEQERMRITKERYPIGFVVVSLINLAIIIQIKTITQAVIIFGIPILILLLQKRMGILVFQKRITILESRKETILRIIFAYLILAFVVGLIVLRVTKV